MLQRNIRSMTKVLQTFANFVINYLCVRWYTDMAAKNGRIAEIRDFFCQSIEICARGVYNTNSLHRYRRRLAHMRAVRYGAREVEILQGMTVFPVTERVRRTRELQELIRAAQL